LQPSLFFSWILPFIFYQLDRRLPFFECSPLPSLRFSLLSFSVQNYLLSSYRASLSSASLSPLIGPSLLWTFSLAILAIRGYLNCSLQVRSATFSFPPFKKNLSIFLLKAVCVALPFGRLLDSVSRFLICIVACLDCRLLRFTPPVCSSYSSSNHFQLFSPKTVKPAFLFCVRFIFFLRTHWSRFLYSWWESGVILVLRLVPPKPPPSAFSPLWELVSSRNLPGIYFLFPPFLLFSDT